jgi:hypothetical protein
MIASLGLDPLLPLWAIALLGTAGIAACGWALWRGLRGWFLRGLAGLIIVAALAGPTLVEQERRPLSDIVIVATDETASNQLSNRRSQTQATLRDITEQLETDGVEIRHVQIADDPNNEGSLIMGALQSALAQEAAQRIAGVLAITDGRAHDAGLDVEFPAPFHVLLTGTPDEWDRRVSVTNAPGFAIPREEFQLTLRVEDSGAAPLAPQAVIDISVNGDPPVQFQIPVGRDIAVPVILPRAGKNVIEFSVQAQPGELTDRNNTALVEVNGVRDRLRVLLVSGEPHAGGRIWRNLLKSDSAVDLVHFTILRPPEKQDGVPVGELALIAFPTRELFLEKISDFDLIIFDRFKRRGILPSAYLDNVAEYVRSGGAVLVSAGPAFAGVNSIYRSPLDQILPAAPTARVLETPFQPTITQDGNRHPVTQGLGTPEAWGRWWRQIEINVQRGQTLMSGAEDRPLLVLDRVGDGRVALLASDHAWLWNRGYDGGGPQLELLRRLAHWLMQEPELEEETLGAQVDGPVMQITRNTMATKAPPLSVTTPGGTVLDIPLVQEDDGRYSAALNDPETGLYILQSDALRAVVGVGTAAPREYAEPTATADLLNGSAHSISHVAQGLPKLRAVRAGRATSGRGWIGITPRNAYEVQGTRSLRLLPEWMALILGLGCLIGAWLIEGRRERA